MGAAPLIIRQAGEGEHRWFAGGGGFTMKATAAQTGGAFVMFEDRVVRGKTTPLHFHPDEDEAIYVLDGELLVHADGEEHRVGRGGMFMAPRGLAHAFLVLSETAHLLCVQAPGTGWAFYEAVSEPVTSLEDAVSRPPDWDLLREVARTSPTIEILGPPPFAALDETAVPVATPGV